MEDTKKSLLKKEWKLIPKCLVGIRCPAYVNTGHISPCCWVDGDDVQNQDYYKALFTEKMKLDNNEEVEDIINHQFKFVSDVIEKGDFDTVRLPYFGKFTVNKNRVKHINRLKHEKDSKKI